MTTKLQRILYHLMVLALLAFSPLASVQASQMERKPLPPIPQTRGEKGDPTERIPGFSNAGSAASDNFGYTIDDTQSPAWEDILASGTVITFTQHTPLDDSYSVALPIHFGFKYYEYTYTTLYVSTNGLVTFSTPSKAFSNTILPNDILPNNLIAAYWDDLRLDGTNSKVMVQYFDAPDRHLTIEWYQVLRLGGTGHLTFQVQLFENGDIHIQYQDLSANLDQETVGMEDVHGVDGLTYLFNSSGLSTSKAVHIIRPAQDYRAKLYPIRRSGLTLHSQADFSLTLRNTGELGADTYNLSYTPNDPDWKVDFYNADGSPLDDSNSDGTPDIGPIPQGSEAGIKVHTSTTREDVGANFPLQVKAASTGNSNRQAVASILVAIPAPFAQIYLDTGVGELQLLWNNSLSIKPVIEGQFTGNSLAFTGIPNGNYFYFWEKNGPPSPDFWYTNLEYTVLNWRGAVVKTVTGLADNASQGVSTEDRSLYLAGADNGRVGAIWVREQISTSQKTNANIYFSLLDENGNKILSPVNLTHNTGWIGESDYDIPTFYSPLVVALENNHYLAAWVESRTFATGETSDILLASFDQDGVQVGSVHKLTNSTTDTVQYYSPSLTNLHPGRALLTFTASGKSDVISQFVILDQNGDPLAAPAAIPGGIGFQMDSIQLTSGPVLLAWCVTGSGKLQFTLMNPTTYAFLPAPIEITSTMGRTPKNVSVTRDASGHGILTWVEQENKNFLAYALIDDQGSLLTPALVFNAGSSPNSILESNSYGLGNAEFPGSWTMSLPFISVKDNR